MNPKCWDDQSRSRKYEMFIFLNIYQAQPIIYFFGSTAGLKTETTFFWISMESGNIKERKSSNKVEKPFDEVLCLPILSLDCRVSNKLWRKGQNFKNIQVGGLSCCCAVVMIDQNLLKALII